MNLFPKKLFPRGQGLWLTYPWYPWYPWCPWEILKTIQQWISLPRSNLHHRGAGVLPGSCHVVATLTRGSDLLVVACCQLRSNRRISSRAHVSYIYGTLAKHQKISICQSGIIRQSTSININTPCNVGLFRDFSLLIWWGAGKLCLRYMWSTIASLMQNGRSCTRARGGVWFGPEPSQTHSILARYWLAGCQFSRMFNL